MQNWLSLVLLIIGSGGVASIIASFIIPIVNHKFQQHRDLEREAREARAAHIERKRQMSLDLMESLIRFRNLIRTMRSFHDDRSSRLLSRGELKQAIQQFPAIYETVYRFRREQDLEPNDHLQGAVDRWGDAGIAYNEALKKAMFSPWNPVKLYIGKAPQDEVNRLAADFDAQTQALQDAVRSYMKSLESPVVAAPTSPFHRFLRKTWRRGLDAPD